MIVCIGLASRLGSGSLLVDGGGDRCLGGRLGTLGSPSWGSSMGATSCGSSSSSSSPVIDTVTNDQGWGQLDAD